MPARALRTMTLLAWVACASSCDKVPIVDINAFFSISDVSWFEEEHTLFVFYRVEAEQGLGPDSVMELRYRTDDVEVGWTPLSELPPVHTHVPVDCGPNTKCGSMSLRVDKVPRLVGLRMRYHAKGVLSLDAPVNFNVIGRGPTHLVRSLVVYGVFDETNTRVQWRARHQFPTLRNEQAQALGLRRNFTISDATTGVFGLVPAMNPYGYALAPGCPVTFARLPWEPRSTNERAFFEPLSLPLSASTNDVVCATATVTDALGEFSAVALARKNPRTKSAFPTLRSPIRELTPIGYVLKPCNRVISNVHLTMQVQRLVLEGEPSLCTDDFAAPGFASRMASTMLERINRVRTAGKDMVLVLAVHRDDTTGRLNRELENVLEQVLTPERDKSSPRVAGAFLFDSVAWRLTKGSLKPLVLWCPSRLLTQMDLDLPSGASDRDCALLPEQPDLQLGPLSFTQLPILPTRQQYETFIMKYGEANAGTVQSLSFLGPERSAVSENIPVGEFGVITKFNNELISAAPSDAFSFCPPSDEQLAASVARVVVQPVDNPFGITQLQGLPELHSSTPSLLYALGLAWESPFLLQMKYEARTAGAATVVITVPFGIASNATRFYGSQQWRQARFSLSEALAQCTEWCDHPTFDSAGVYQPLASFRAAYASQCYVPAFPTPDAGGFPVDP